MIFEETVLTKGTRIYKGTRIRSVMLRDMRYFFATTNSRVARVYGQTSAYLAKKPLRLFTMSVKNLKLLVTKYPGLSKETRTLLRFALGVGTTRAQQVQAYKVLYGTRAFLPGARNKRPGQRLSIADIDHDLAKRLTREFLRPERYDGYYSPSKRTIFHSGLFHSEIMLCDATHSLERPVNSSRPRVVVDQRSLVDSLPQLFVAYCKTHRRLTRQYGGFVPYLGGGMAVKLYLEARALRAPAKVRNTSDFDFTFAVPRRLRSRIDISNRIFAMRQIMSRHVSGFITWLNKEYKATGAKLVVVDFVPPIRVLPATGKTVYQVISYKLQFPGMSKPIDFVDSTLAYVPGISREHLHLPYTRLYGIPMERLKYMYRNVAVVLAGSFVYPGIKNRNPLTGNRPEKGLKNTARLSTLLRIKKKSYGNGTVQNFIKKIYDKNVEGARLRARQIINAIKRTI
jgi:hypothetical protein